MPETVLFPTLKKETQFTFKSQNEQPLFVHLKYLFQGEKCPSQLPSIGIIKFFWKKKDNRKKFSINKTDNMEKKKPVQISKELERKGHSAHFPLGRLLLKKAA